ncbi:MAG: DNA repair protein RecO [Phycisphaerales bacterium]|nr:DNA repair protein RecO [Phycisphaerales bacterium]
MAMYLHDDAVCLRVRDFSETSQIVALFAKSHGLISAIAKGSKRTGGKSPGAFSGPLDPLCQGEIIFIAAKHAGELATLTAWNLTDPAQSLRRNWRAWLAAQLMAEVTLAVLEPHDPHPELFLELQAALSHCQNLRMSAAYLKAALSAAGLQPQLDTCRRCGQMLAQMPANAPVWFAPAIGGMFCHGCRRNEPAVATITPVLRALARLPAPTTLQTAPPPARPADPIAVLDALRLLVAQIQTLSERRLHTAEFLPMICGINGKASSPNAADVSKLVQHATINSREQAP